MRIYDISMEFHPKMPVWKNREEKKPSFEIERDHPRDGARETRISLNLHTGTHIDAPLHFVENGVTIEHTTLEQLVRKVKVVDLTHLSEEITASDLQHLDIRAGDFLLFKTRNSFEPNFDLKFVFIEKTGARYLAQREIAGVGIDALGIERDQPKHESHLALLSEDIVVIEGLRLAHVEPGEYWMVAAPLKLVGVEAAPARVFLLDKEMI